MAGVAQAARLRRRAAPASQSRTHPISLVQRVNELFCSTSRGQYERTQLRELSSQLSDPFERIVPTQDFLSQDRTTDSRWREGIFSAAWYGTINRPSASLHLYLTDPDIKFNDGRVASIQGPAGSEATAYLQMVQDAVDKAQGLDMQLSFFAVGRRRVPVRFIRQEPYMMHDFNTVVGYQIGMAPK